MEFKLTEEQSYELLSHFDNFQGIINAVNECAFDIMHSYYQIYLSNPENWLFRPMSKVKFFDKMAKSHSTFCADECFGTKRVYSYNYAEVNIDFLKEFNLPCEPIAITMIHEAVEAPYFESTKVLEVKKLHEIILNFGTIPYVVDTDVLNLFLYVKKLNEKHLEVLNAIGVKYEL